MKAKLPGAYTPTMEKSYTSWLLLIWSYGHLVKAEIKLPLVSGCLRISNISSSYYWCIGLIGHIGSLKGGGMYSEYTDKNEGQCILQVLCKTVQTTQIAE